jgi:hypothetical protein
MALTLGTDTYISLEDARTYCTNMGVGPLPTEDADAEALLKRAAKALDRRWGNRFIGVKSSLSQAMAWPRDVAVTGAYRGQGESWAYTLDSDGNPRDFNSIPVEMGEAQVEMALFIEAGEDPLQQNAPTMSEYSVTVDVISETKKYAHSYQQPAFYNVLVILRPLLVPTSGSISATRGA